MKNSLRNIVLSLCLITFSHVQRLYACDAEAILSEIAYPGYLDAYENLKKIPVNTFAGHVSPTWNDFHHLEAAIDALTKQNSLIKRSDAEVVLKKVREIFKKDREFLNRQLAQTNITLEPNYVTNIDLKILFFDAVHELNKRLPRSARFLIKSKPRTKRHAEYINEAKNIVKRLSTETKKRFEKNEYKTPENVVQAVKQQGPIYNDLIDMVMNEKVEFAMVRPSRGRWWIGRLGFQNQRITGSSGGILNIKRRNDVEAKRSLSDPQAYETLSSEIKPNYGYLRPPLNSNYKVRYPKEYGDDIYILDKTNLKDRVTWTYMDSLSLENNNDLWNALSTPWSERELLLPYLMKKFTENIFDPTFSALHGMTGFASGYVELQFWGPVDLSSVKKFIYLQTPPDDEYAKILTRFGIEIIDGRSGHIPNTHLE